MDPVIGLDFHLQIVLRPPIPPFVCPFPHPFVGLVLDLGGLVAGIALTNVLGSVLGGGGGFVGPVLVNWLPATNAGTEVRGLPILHYPYMGSWLPFPRLKPPIRPDDVVKPDPPIPPNEAVIITGSDSVNAMGGSMSRMGDTGLSCSDPIPLPLSFIIAVPKGRPVLVGGGTTIDFLSAAFSILPSKFITAPLREGVGRRIRRYFSHSRFDRLRNRWPRLFCFLTGHPVDVATGRMLTSAIDAELRGPWRLVFERTYYSSWSHRQTSLGWGWSHAYDEALWPEPGRMVLRLGDGREIEFDTFDHPARQLRVGDEVTDPVDRLTLRRAHEDRFTVSSEDGSRRELARVVPDRTGGPTYRLVAWHRRGHTVRFEYDDRGLLVQIVDAVGRAVRLVNDEQGRLVTLALPHPEQEGAWEVAARYVYDARGDLCEVHDAGGAVTRYAYEDHLMVQETNRVGESYYFGYDGRDSSARCVRTWGDGGLFDHVLTYDTQARVTQVEDSHGARTEYRMNDWYAVVRVREHDGAVVSYTYDDFMRLTAIERPGSERLEASYDARGNLTEVTSPNGHRTLLEWDERDRLSALELPGSGRWRFDHDEEGRMIHAADPEQRVTSADYDKRGFLVSLSRAGEERVTFLHDAWGNCVGAQQGALSSARTRFDRRSRPVEVADGAGAVQFHYDRRDRVVAIARDDRALRMATDAEGSLVAVTSPSGATLMSADHGGKAWPLSETRGGSTLRYRRDTEGRLVGVEGSIVGPLMLKRDIQGRLIEERLGEQRVRYSMDARGRVVSAVDALGDRAEQDIDPDGLITRQRFFDGATLRVRYDAAGRAEAIHDGVKERRVRYDGGGRVAEDVFDGGRCHFSRDERGRLTRAVHEQGGRSISTELVYLKSGLGVDEHAGRLQVRYEVDTHGDLSSMRSPEGIVTRYGVVPGGGYHIEREGLAIRVGQAGDALVHTLRQGGSEVTMRVDFDEGGRLRRQVVRAGATALERDWRYSNGLLEAVTDAWGVTRYSHADGRTLLSVEHGEVRERFTARPGGMVRGDGKGWVLGPGNRVMAAGSWRIDHDDAGRRVSADDGSCEVGYRWNGRNQLLEVRQPGGTRIELDYDAFGRRVRKATYERGSKEPVRTTELLWHGDRIVAEYRDGELGREWLYVPGSAIPVVQIERGIAYLCVFDQVGKIGELVRADGHVAWSARMDAYGRIVDERAEEGGPRCPFRLAGHYEDEETGLFATRFRVFDPASMRWLSPDPLGFAAGPDRYGFGGSPAHHADVLGLSTCRLKLDNPKTGHIPLPRSPDEVDDWMAKMRASGARIFVVHPDMRIHPEALLQYKGEAVDRLFKAQIQINKIRRYLPAEPRVWNDVGVWYPLNRGGTLDFRELEDFMGVPGEKVAAITLDTPIILMGGWFNPQTCSGCVDDQLRLFKDMGFTDVTVHPFGVLTPANESIPSNWLNPAQP
ncbi:DUF6531 domain-containing protein [Sorangium sp. So ce204]|uniref:DUF6531 domain-containing protein n=1 Tax=Sorangium sp. So ce204 TaxID=3133288 RepID=UPI003F607CE6